MIYVVKEMGGNRYGRWLVLERAGTKKGLATWVCRCDCGTIREMAGAVLRRGSTNCGCDPASVPNLKHGSSRGRKRTPEYWSWISMRCRCTNSKIKNFDHYGGRGISFDPRWDSFETFLADMGPRPPGTSLDRIDNDGNYEPGNCRWATTKQQASNKGTNVRVIVNGRQMSAREAAQALGVHYETILRNRRFRGKTEYTVP